ncbi:unnamed protein product, partial [Mesorhabditis belari]|uniref:Uncharacterized protein n=1 Tax=Mesorhabditis belari TaxID=2138241 RepID=A0AAF3F8X5_9BILA
MNESETKFVYVKPPVKHMILKIYHTNSAKNLVKMRLRASLLLMIMANIALFFAVYEMAPLNSTNYLTFGAIMLTANAFAAISVINDNWKFLMPLFIVLIPCVFTPILFFLYYISIPLFCKLGRIFAKNERNGTLTKDDLIDACVHEFPATDSPQAYIFLYFGLEKLLELYLVSKLIRLMQKDQEFLRSRDQDEQRRTNDEESEDDMIVYEKIPRNSSKAHPTDVIDRHAPIQ